MHRPRACCAWTNRPPGSTRAKATSWPDLLRRIRDGAIDTPCSVLLIEHDMGVVMRISDFIVVLDHGKKIAEGPPASHRAPTRP